MDKSFLFLAIVLGFGFVSFGGCAAVDSWNRSQVQIAKIQAEQKCNTETKENNDYQNQTNWRRNP